MDTCKTCKVLFQKHANSGPKFLKFLHEDFSRYLRISNENLGNAREAFKNRKFINVKGPNGIYKIGLKMFQDAIILDKGWAEFHRAHRLCNTDKLKFSCGCHDIFLVHIYDRNGELVGKRFAPETKTVPEQSSNRKRKEVPPTELDVIAISSDSSGGNTPESDTSDSSLSEEEEVVKLQRAFISHRRPVTDVEKRRAHSAAKRFHPSRAYFLKKMKKKNVYRNFSLAIQTEFARANLPAKPINISLKTPGKTEKWGVNCTFTVYKSGQKVWRIHGGWWRFILANNLEDGDVCVFELMKMRLSRLGKKEKIKMKVHIFRVVEEIVPLKVL